MRERERDFNKVIKNLDKAYGCKICPTVGFGMERAQRGWRLGSKKFKWKSPVFEQLRVIQRSHYHTWTTPTIRLVPYLFNFRNSQVAKAYPRRYPLSMQFAGKCDVEPGRKGDQENHTLKHNEKIILKNILFNGQ